MNPGEVITVIAKFDLPNMAVFNNRPPSLVGLLSPKPKACSSADLPNANEYVWHCHILEHEEHDMMHALVVTNPLTP